MSTATTTAPAATQHINLEVFADFMVLDDNKVPTFCPVKVGSTLPDDARRLAPYGARSFTFFRVTTIRKYLDGKPVSIERFRYDLDGHYKIHPAWHRPTGRVPSPRPCNG